MLRTIVLVALCLTTVTSVLGQVKDEQHGRSALAWNSSDEGRLFIEDPEPKSKDGLIYDGGKFSLRLADALTYDRELDVFSFWVGFDWGAQLIVMRRVAGAYRGQLPGVGDLGLNDLGKLKLIWLASGERLLFTEVNGAWRSVMVEDARGRKVYVDYDREGAIVLVRDGVRRAEPVYKDGGRLDSVYQSWPLRSGGRELALIRVGK